MCWGHQHASQRAVTADCCGASTLCGAPTPHDQAQNGQAQQKPGLCSCGRTAPLCRSLGAACRAALLPQGLQPALTWHVMHTLGVEVEHREHSLSLHFTHLPLALSREVPP